ncbi:MAG: tetratricopeptide repeat protein, partial [Chloroflexota bacterium]
MAKAFAESFARLLTEPVYQIRHRESKSVQAVQDELGYALGKKGGSSIEYWRKGYVPTKTADIEALTTLIVNRGAMSRTWAEAFLASAQHPDPAPFLDRLFPAQRVYGGETAVSPSPPFILNLPLQPTPFIGRQKEMAAITAQIDDPNCRLLTLVGPGGVGKTRLALQAAGALAAHFPDGVYFVPLAALNSPEFLLSTIANAINISFLDEIPQKTQLITHLRDKKILLILDNFEHLMMEAPLIADIIHAAPQIQILLTSRERLNLHGEWAFDVGGLTFPQRPKPGMWAEAQTWDMEAYSAVQLFVQSAQRVRADFSLTAADKPMVIEICRLVHGFPLAIELAAGWVRLLTCAEIAQEITRSYEFLSTNWRDMPPRHRSLQAVFAYSWGLLPPAEQEALRRLAVFQGGFSREAATAVSAASLFTLAQLVDKSFLQGNVMGGETAVSHYEMHELLRQFVVEKLNQDARLEIHGDLYSEAYVQAADHHAHYFARFMHDRNPQQKQPYQAALLSEIAQEIDNVRAAWHWALNRQDMSAIQDIFDTLFHFYDTRGWLQEGNELFKTAVVHLRRLRDQNVQAVDDVLWGKMLAREGQFSYRLGLYQRARLLIEESLPIFRQRQMHPETVFLLNLLGRITYRQGAYAQSEQSCQESLALCREITHPAGMASALATLGHVAADRGDYARAQQFYLEGLEICEHIGDLHNKARRLNELGNMSWRLGSYDKAEKLCRQSLAIFQELDDRQGIAMTYKNLGNIAADSGSYQQAESWYRQGLAICREIGDRWGVAALANNLGNIYSQSGQYAQARQLCEQSVAVWREFGFQWGIAGSL